MRTLRPLAVVVALAASSACGPANVDGPLFGRASGTFDTEVYLPGSNPPNYGQAVIQLDIEDEHPRTLVQGASVLAIDADGLPTLDPETAVYFALQVFQFTSETSAEVFELRVSPEYWVDDTDVFVNTQDADAVYGEVTFDANGQQVAGQILLTAIRGDLHIDRAGLEPTDEVTGTLANLEMVSP